MYKSSLKYTAYLDDFWYEENMILLLDIYLSFYNIHYSEQFFDTNHCQIYCNLANCYFSAFWHNHPQVLFNL